MEFFWFWFLVILFAMMIAAWPAWPYTRERWVYRRGDGWRYAPSAAAAGIALLVLALFWLGIIAIALPWSAVAV